MAPVSTRRRPVWIRAARFRTARSRTGLSPTGLSRVAALVAALVAAVVAVPVAGAESSGAAPPHAAVASVGIRVSTEDFPDPDVIAVGSVYWAYATGSQGRNIQVLSTSDLAKGATPGDALPTLPSWAVAGMTWAPGVVELPSGFVMYYTVHDGSSGRQCVSVATSATPGGPFKDSSSAPFECQLADGGSIDPSPFVAPDGRLYLVWKSDDNGIGGTPKIWAQRLSPNGLSLLGSPSQLLTQDAPWQTPVIEGPAMMALDGRYFLFYGANLWNTVNSGVGYAVCSSPVGPCTDVSLGHAWLGTHGGIVGPAAPAPFWSVDGAPLFAYHAWTGPVTYTAGGVRSLWIGVLVFTPGYRATSRDGGVFSFGTATYLGSASQAHPRAPIVAIAQTSDGGGYWQVGSDGGVFSFGNAAYYGSTGAVRLVAPVVGMMASPDDRGYALVARDGGVFTYGDFAYAGSDGAVRTIVPVVGGATSALLDGSGYWLARADGSVDAFGAAPALGSLNGAHLRAPVVAIAADPSGIGYWLLGGDGSVFAFGGARSFGSVTPAMHAAPITGIVPTPTGAGYWLVARDGGVYSFGDAAFAGSLAGTPLVAGVVGGTGAPSTPICPC
jgi:Glycosyl hydrolases family 43